MEHQSHGQAHAPGQTKASPDESADDFGHRDPIVIGARLRNLVNGNDFLTVQYAAGQLVTQLLDVDARTRTFTVDWGAATTQNRGLLSAADCRFSAEPEGVRVEFATPADLDRLDDTSLWMIFALFIAGLGVKAARVPLHGWLPAAMAAPAPVSALLHAVAVVKAGAFGVMRIVLDVFGLERVVTLGVGLPLAALAALTILWGSARALQQQEIKKRLAFSTVSQVSYIILGIALASPFAVIGGLVHLVHQGLMKITLFFCAGIFDERAGITRVDALDGIGRQMPWTSVCFSIGAFGMIGLPPTAGFISKIYLGIGALQADAPWVLAVLAASTLLNAAYFLPLVYRIWFGAGGTRALAGDAPTERPLGLIAPPVITAAASVAVALLAASAFSPLGWATLIATRGYLP